MPCIGPFARSVLSVRESGIAMAIAIGIAMGAGVGISFSLA